MSLSFESYRQLALSFPDAEQKPHFDKISFRVGSSIFATYWKNEHRAVLLLSLIDQSIYCDYNPEIFFPLPNKWGLKGATFVELKKVTKPVFKEALTASFNNMIKKKPIPKKKSESERKTTVKKKAIPNKKAAITKKSTPKK